LPPMTPLSNAANMRSFRCGASTYHRYRSFVSAPCLTLTGTTGTALCSRCGSYASTFLPPFPQSGFASRSFSELPRNGTMETLTPAPLTPQCRSPRLPRHTFLSFRLQPRGLPDHRLPPRQRDRRVSDFAMNEQARRSSPPNRGRHPADRQFAFRLLSTPLRSDAVTFGYGVVAFSDMDFHHANVAPSRAHSFRWKPESTRFLNLNRKRTWIPAGVYPEPHQRAGMTNFRFA
jgi:hypothetical protein